MRPDISTWGLMVARVVSLRATCPRRQVGCVLLDDHGFILSTGYNGVAPGLPHCVDKPCPGIGLPAGTGLDLCEAIHAEANALITCPDVGRVARIYITTSPCIHCVKLLMRTSAKELYFIEEYAGSEGPKFLWERDGRLWIHKPIP